MTLPSIYLKISQKSRWCPPTPTSPLQSEPEFTILLPFSPLFGIPSWTPPKASWPEPFSSRSAWLLLRKCSFRAPWYLRRLFSGKILFGFLLGCSILAALARIFEQELASEFPGVACPGYFQKFVWAEFLHQKFDWADFSILFYNPFLYHISSKFNNWFLFCILYLCHDCPRSLLLLLQPSLPLLSLPRGSFPLDWWSCYRNTIASKSSKSLKSTTATKSTN